MIPSIGMICCLLTFCKSVKTEVELDSYVFWRIGEARGFDKTVINVK